MSKKIGHNKLQIHIESLNNEILKLNNIIDIQKEELSLFKNNFYEINKNLQYKHNLLDESTKELLDLKNKNSLLIEKINTINNKNLQLINILETKYTNILNEKNMYLKNLNESTKNYSDLQVKYDNLKISYNNLYIILEQKDKENMCLQKSINTLQKEFNLKNKLNEKSHNKKDTQQIPQKITQKEITQEEITQDIKTIEPIILKINNLQKRGLKVSKR